MGEENLKVKEKEVKPGAEGKGPGPEGDKSAVSAKEVSNLDFILDIPLEISVELGRTKLLISELLQLGQGSVIELQQALGRAAGNLCQPETDRPGGSRGGE